jgi:hypothetical protein
MSRWFVKPMDVPVGLKFHKQFKSWREGCLKHHMEVLVCKPYSNAAEREK